MNSVPDHIKNPAALDDTPDVGRLPFLIRLHRAWSGSLRFRLFSLGLMPLVIAFPFVIAVLVLIGGERANNLIFANLHSNLAGTRNYLNQVKTDAGVRVDQLVKSERLIQLLHTKPNRRELDQLLVTAARGSGLDFLVIAESDGSVIGSSTGVAAGAKVPDSFVIRQARIGIANAGYERFEGSQLSAFSPHFPDDAKVETSPKQSNNLLAETRGLMINAAAHFPLTASETDSILIGGILLNKDFTLIEHMRAIIFPVGVLPEDSEGVTSIHVYETTVAISRERRNGMRIIGTRPPPEVAASVFGKGLPWTGRIEFGGESYIAGYEPIVDGDGRRIGMLGAGFPYAPYQKAILLMLGMIAGLLALTMLVISVLFLRTGRELTQRLASIAEAVTKVRHGDRNARVGGSSRNDELGQLAHHFDALLNTIADQDELSRTSQQVISDEASRRRALFEHERDGVVILNPDGSVFEVNPKGAAMLGYGVDEFSRLRLWDWDAYYSAYELDQVLASVGAEGVFFETKHRRKDGSTYPAEVSVSLAHWGEKTFWLILSRDISERKAVDAELAEYRINLEHLVDERTRELNNRSEQLNAIFTLSPDGFVSFDADRKIIFANQAFLRMASFDISEINNLDEARFSDLLQKKCVANSSFPGVAALRAVRRKLVANEESIEPNETRRQLMQLAGPGNRVLEISIRLSETENVSQILYFRDVTHETEVDRMKSEFLSMAAHELRTPMASIYGYSELLMQDDFDDAMRRDMAGTIFRQSELMVSIINELLDLARIEARRGMDFVVERQSLSEIVAAVIAGYKLPDGREPPVLGKLDWPIFVSVDRKKIQQSVLNILSNAYKYSPSGGAVSINCRKAAGRIGIEIRDQGIGMSAKERNRVCERFYRADTSGKIPGTGLGMSIVKEIIELHGGSVELESQIGAGSTVTLWIPCD
jgi:PAS domain S-box-containing protein